MLPFLKKKNEAVDLLALPAWHPDFRNTAGLPDIKVVRTAFFVNGAALAAALSLGGFFLFKEWELSLINAQITQLRVDIARDKPASDRAVALYKSFQTSEAKLGEVDAFIKSKPLVSVLMLRLAKTRPANIAIDSLDLRDTGITMRLSIRGDAAVASGHATAYLEQLKNDNELAQFDDVTFTGSPVRNPSTGRMAVEFMLRLRPPPVTKKKS
jgi:hypothetical protein